MHIQTLSPWVDYKNRITKYIIFFQTSDLSNNSPTTLGPSSARQLHEMLHITGCHEDVVLSSTFSPHDLTLVTGCLSGKVVWNQPVL